MRARVQRDTMKATSKSRASMSVPRLQAFTYGSMLYIAGLFLVVLATYWNSLGGGFHFDDQGIFLDPYVAGPGAGWEIFRPMQTRPLTFLSFHWNLLLWGRDAFSFHAVNVLLHAVNTILVLLIARRWMPRLPAWFAAALFATHPLQTQAVNYVFERATLLATCFAFLSLLLFLRERYALSALSCGLSLLAKEETIALPAFLFLLSLLQRPRRLPSRYFGALLVLCALAALRLFYVMHNTPNQTLGFGVKGISPSEYALTQTRVIWTYLRLFLFPVGLNLDHDVRVSEGLFTPPATAFSLVLLLLAVGALGWLVWRKNQVALWALGFFILLAPSSSVVPVKDVVFEHRTYFPLLCLCMATAFLLLWVPARYRVWVIALTLAPLIVTTVLRNRVWHDSGSLWTDVVEKSPHKGRGYFHLAQWNVSRDAARARQLYETGLQIEPDNSDAWMNLGLVLLASGDSDTAIAHLRKALTIGGNQPIVWNNLGAAHLRRGEVDAAIEAFRRALQADSCRYDARMNLVRTLAQSDDRTAALEAATVPSHCRLLPEQSRQIDGARLSLR